MLCRAGIPQHICNCNVKKILLKKFFQTIPHEMEYFSLTEIKLRFIFVLCSYGKCIYCIGRVGWFLSGVSIKTKPERMLLLSLFGFCPFTNASKSKREITIRVLNVEHLTLLVLFYARYLA